MGVFKKTGGTFGYQTNRLIRYGKIPCDRITAIVTKRINGRYRPHIATTSGHLISKEIAPVSPETALEFSSPAQPYNITMAIYRLAIFKMGPSG